MKEEYAYQLKIELIDSNPLVWRTLAIPKDATLNQLHECIQILFGWMDFHNYELKCKKTNQTYVRYPEEWEEESEEESKPLSTTNVRLSECFQVGEEWEYLYDFGDYWLHHIIIEKEIKLERKGKAGLLSWEQDNMAEDAGGVYGFYEKMEILNDPEHEDYEYIKDWMEIQHRPFIAKKVQKELLNLEKDFFADRPQLRIADYCNHLFMVTSRDTLFTVETAHNHFDIWFADHEDVKYVYFFRDEQTFLHAFHADIDHDNIYPLYHGGYRLDYPNADELEEVDLPSDLLMPRIRKFEPALGEVKAEKDEIEEIREVITYLHNLRDEFSANRVFLPDLSEKQKLLVSVTDEEVQYEIVDYEAKLKIPHKRLRKSESELLKNKKHTKEKLHMNLICVPDLIHIGDQLYYYVAASGIHSSFMHALTQFDIDKVMDEVKDQFVSYMISYGIPQALYVSDLHLYESLFLICKQLGVDLVHQRCDTAVIMEQYEEAMVEKNPFEEFDQKILDKIADLSDEEMIRFVEEQSDDKMKRLLKQILFMNIFIKE